MSKPAKPSTTPRDLGEALAKTETPRIKWQVVAQIGAALAVLWVTAFMVQPYVGYWGVGVMGVLSLVVLGFGIYIWRLTSKQAAILDIMKGATDAEGRERALLALAQGEGKDVMKTLARAQLLAQSDPAAAMQALESIDLKKAPAMLQDDVRAQLAMMYLFTNRTRDARELIDQLRIDRRPDAKSKAMYAGIMAEGLARTGSPDEARKLLETYNADDKAFEDVRVNLLRAQVYTFASLKKRGLVKRAIDELGAIEPNLI
ncbi:MAG TPA: tetratricopeptide repeat protein, partial [Polyangiales bacterium]|nr:tetratricopeptide repeat protein [Polyangiales bacterium]